MNTKELLIADCEMTAKTIRRILMSGLDINPIIQEALSIRLINCEAVLKQVEASTNLKKSAA